MGFFLKILVNLTFLPLDSFLITEETEKRDKTVFLLFFFPLLCFLISFVVFEISK